MFRTSKLKELLKRKPLFLVLIPLFFIYNGYNELFGFLTFGFVLENTLQVLLVTAVMFGISQLLLRNTTKAAVATFFILVFYLSFGFLHDSLKSLPVHRFFYTYSFLLPFALLITIGIYRILYRSKSNFHQLFLYINLLFTALILSEIPHSVKRYRLDQSVHNLLDFRFKALNAYNPSAPTPDSLKPDIYFLVFDAYASSKSLKDELQKDNSVFENFLKQQGFYTIEKSAANYNFTIHSISTTFNMEYLPEFILPVMKDPKAYFWGTASILDNSLFSILKKEQYRIHNLQPISFNNPQWPLDPYFNDLKERHFFFKTFPGRIYRDIFWNYNQIEIGLIKKIQHALIDKRNEEIEKRLQYTKQAIENTCSKVGPPKFVYGHFMLPHEPYVFDRNGRIQTRNYSNQKSPDFYFEQLLYANSILSNLITHIKTNNKRNTVIIVEGDHGYQSFTGKKNNFTSFENLNSLYFPDQDYGMLNDSLSPINTFRIVLNKYFHAGFPLLENLHTPVSADDESINPTKKILPAHSLSDQDH